MSNQAPSPIGNIASLQGKVALITGASSGLGRSIAQAYAAAGAYIVSADLTPNPPNAPIVAETLKDTDLKTPTVELINKLWPGEGKDRIVFVECNVTSSDSVEAAVNKAVEVYGRLDIMVNNAVRKNENAGMLIGRPGISAETLYKKYQESSGALVRIHELPEEVIDRSLAVNVKGVWLGCKFAAGQMLKQDPHPSGDRGWIINMCSICGHIGLSGASAYCASKGAVAQITRTVALEYAKEKIHVNMINPGFAETNLLEPMKTRGGKENVDAMLNSIHPWGRIGRPEDIARVAVFLAGEGAGWMTGTGVFVDGGYTAQ